MERWIILERFVRVQADVRCGPVGVRLSDAQTTPAADYSAALLMSGISYRSCPRSH